MVTRRVAELAHVVGLAPLLAAQASEELTRQGRRRIGASRPSTHKVKPAPALSNQLPVAAKPPGP